MRLMFIQLQKFWSRRQAGGGFPVLVLELDQVATGALAGNVFGAVGDGGLPAGFAVDNLFFAVGADDAEFGVGEHDEGVGRVRVQAEAAAVFAGVGAVFDDARAVVFEEEFGGFGGAGLAGAWAETRARKKPRAPAARRRNGVNLAFMGRPFGGRNF